GSGEGGGEEMEGRKGESRGGRKEKDAKPAHGIPIDGPKSPSFGVSGQIAEKQTHHAKHDNDPAVAAILALACADMTAAKQRGNAKREPDNHQRDAGRFRNEIINAARAPDGERQIACRRNQRNQNQQKLTRSSGLYLQKAETQKEAITSSTCSTTRSRCGCCSMLMRRVGRKRSPSYWD